MNVLERRNLTYRILASLVILLNLGFVGFCMSYVAVTPTRDQTITLIGCVFAAVLMIGEIVLLLRGGKQEPLLYKVFFNPNGRLNNVPLVFISVFCVIGVGLLLLGTLLNVFRHFEPNITISLFVLLVAVYLISNCLIYYLFCIMFKKKEFKLEYLIK